MTEDQISSFIILDKGETKRFLSRSINFSDLLKALMRKMKKMKQQHKEQKFGGLPDDIMMKIFSELPVRSLLQFKSVCKSWRNMITAPHFIKLHLNRSIQDESNNLHVILRDSSSCRVYSFHHQYHHDQVEASSPSSLSIELNDVTPWKSSPYSDKIFGSCNGLILLGRLDRYQCRNERVALWNPTTRELSELPKPQHFGLFDNRVVFGLGYDSTNDDYKVVGIKNEKVEHKVVVYSLQSRRWRSIGTIAQFVDKRDSGKYINGAIHWFSDDLKKILYFDCELEEWNEVGLPEECCRFTNRGLLMFERRGMLCLYHCNKEGDAWGLGMYEMRENGLKESWHKIFIMSYGDWERTKSLRTRGLCVVKGGNLLFGDTDRKQLTLHNFTKGYSTVLIINDTNVMKKKKKKKKNQQPMQLYHFCRNFCEPYISSLVSPKPRSRRAQSLK